MIREIFGSMNGIEIYGMVSMIFFFLVFLGVIYWSIKADKKYLAKMKEMPLESSTQNGD